MTEPSIMSLPVCKMQLRRPKGQSGGRISFETAILSLAGIQ